MNDLTDQELLDNYFKYANQNAFEVIFNRHSGVLFSYVYRFTLNQQAADEIVQDVFTELLLGRFNETLEGSLKSWLFTVARNKSLNHIKKQSYEVKSDSSIAEKKDIVDLEENLIQSQLLGRLQLSESILPPEILKTWNLRKQGFDNNEISKQLSIPIGTVKSRFFRLVEIIKEEFLK